MNHKVKIYRNLTLPKSMNDKLLTLAKGKTLQNCYYLLWAVMEDFRRKYQNVETFKPMPQTRLLKMIGAGYTKPLYILLDNDLLERTEHFAKGLCFSYRQHPSYYDEEETVKVKFTYYAKMNKAQYTSMKSEREAFLEVFRSLDIPYDKMYAKVQEKLSKLSIEDYKTDMDVHWEYEYNKVIEVNAQWSHTEHLLTKTDAILIAEQKGKMIIQDGGRVLMVDPEYFLTAKKAYIKSSWTASIDNLKDEATLYAKRNGTNNRLDTNFTNMTTELYELVLQHNNLGQSDVQNSQPALLGYVLNKEGVKGADVDKYIQLTKEGKFYEYFEKYGKTRSEAKFMTFNILFGRGFTSKMSRLFVKDFPNVADYIRQFKKDNGYKSFSVMLQRLESEIFIDNIYYPLCDEGLKVLTRHDSITFSQGDAEVVATRIKEVFKGMNFQASLKEDNINNTI